MGEKLGLIEQMVPTIIIGAGGLGKEILKRLKTRYSEHWDEIKQKGKLFIQAIDYGEEDAAWLSTDEKYDLMDITSIMELIGDSDVSDFPEISEWLNVDVWNRILTGNYYNFNTEMERQVGRLSFFLSLNYTNNRIPLGDKLKELIKKPESGFLNIFIISSTCGGTGSGIAIDLAYVIRHIARKNNVKVNIAGVFLLPELIDSYEKDYLEANTWAFLEELQYFMVPDVRKRVFQSIKYPVFNAESPIDNVKVLSKPFDQVYIISNVTASRRKYKSEKVFDKIIDFIEFTSLREINLKLLSRISYIKELKNIKAKSMFSSFGITSTEIPDDKIKEWIVDKFLLEYFDNISEVRTENFFNENIFTLNNWSYNLLVEDILTDVKVKDIFSRLENSVFDDFLIFPPEEFFKNQNEKIKEHLEPITQNLIDGWYSELKSSISKLFTDSLRFNNKLSVKDLVDIIDKIKINMKLQEVQIRQDLNVIENRVAREEAKILKDLQNIQSLNKQGSNIQYKLQQIKTKEIERGRDVFKGYILSSLLQEFYPKFLKELDDLKFKLTRVLNKIYEKKHEIRNEMKTLESAVFSDNSIFKIASQKNDESVSKYLTKLYLIHKSECIEKFNTRIEAIENPMEVMANFYKNIRELAEDSTNFIMENISFAYLLDNIGIDLKFILYNLDEYAAILILTNEVESRSLGVFPKEFIVIGGGTKIDIDKFSKIVETKETNTEFEITGDPSTLYILKMYHGYRLKDIYFSENYIKNYFKFLSNIPVAPLHVFPEFVINDYLIKFLLNTLVTGGLVYKDNLWSLNVEKYVIEGEDILDLLMKIKKYSNQEEFKSIINEYVNKSVRFKHNRVFESVNKDDIWFKILLNRINILQQKVG